MPVFAVRPRLHLAKAYRANGDATTARHLLKEIDDILVHRPDLGALVDEVDEFRQILTLGAPAGATGGAPLSTAELRLLPFLQTHLTIREIGQRLFVSRNTANSEIARSTGSWAPPHAATRCGGRWPSACSAVNRRHGPD